MYASQAIETKYHGPTDTKGSRIGAVSASGIKVYIDYPHELSGVNCHAKAAERLARQLEWLMPEDRFEAEYMAGRTRSGYVFVRIVRSMEDY
jgi:hypothetical protein